MTCILLRYLLRLTRPNRDQRLCLPRERCRTSLCERCDGALLVPGSDDRCAAEVMMVWSCDIASSPSLASASTSTIFTFLKYDRMPRTTRCTWPPHHNYRDDTKQRCRGFANRSDHLCVRVASVREMSSDPSHLPVRCLTLAVTSIEVGALPLF